MPYAKIARDALEECGWGDLAAEVWRRMGALPFEETLVRLTDE
jgi:hypothetical protein